jgi:hypothetical protein
LDVTNSKDEEGREVIVSSCTKQINQKWSVLYLDKAKAVQSKGLNKNFGFHINRPFYIRSRLPMQRVIECNGGHMNVTLKRWRKNDKHQ